jgi:hypothetical protein
MPSVEQLINDYSLGHISRLEMVNRLCDPSIQLVPEEVAPLLERQILENLKRYTLIMPEQGTTFVSIRSSCGGTAIPFPETSNTAFQGMLRWHRYFAESTSK